MNTIGSLNAPLKSWQISFRFYRKQNAFVCHIQHRPFAEIQFFIQVMLKLLFYAEYVRISLLFDGNEVAYEMKRKIVTAP